MHASSEHGYRTISPTEAERLVGEDAVRLLDVRSPAEYRDLGHIPGSILLPIDLIAAAVATLSRDGKPLLVYCEHGIRSAHAASFLARAGFAGILNMAGGMSSWHGARDHSPGDPFGQTGPSSWIVANADLLPRAGEILDVACGRGRHALLMAAAGYSVRAVDRNEERIAALSADAARLALAVRAEAVDLETEAVDLGMESYDVVLCINYLHRPLFPLLARALRRGGLLLYETFTVGQAERGHPKNPAFLLSPGELPRLVAPLLVERTREGAFEGSMVSSVAARKPSR